MSSLPQQSESRGGQSRWLFVLIAVALLGGTVLIGLLSSRPEATPTDAPGAAPPVENIDDLPPAHGDSDTDAAAIERISAADAQARLAEGNAVFVDVRTGEEYAAAHVPAALSITSPDLSAQLDAVPAESAIITYGATEDASVRAAQIFYDLEYPNVVALEGGFEGWQRQGYPTEEGGLNF